MAAGPGEDGWVDAEASAEPDRSRLSSEAGDPDILTLPPPPVLAPAAAHLFGDRLDLAERYAGLLVGPGQLRGLVGPHERDRIWDRHLLNCAALAELIPRDARLVDVGSGAGLPGVVLALARPDLEVVLVEPLLRRVAFLQEAVAWLGLERVRVQRGRAEELDDAALFADGKAADVVTARAVAPMARLAVWCLPLLRPGGMLLALKGEGAQAELADAAGLLDRMGVRARMVRRVGVGRIAEPSTVVLVRLGDTAVTRTLAQRLQRGEARTRRSGE